ncbi:hypothetical protein pb186bvf_011069 [Paramecium bursaria]
MVFMIFNINNNELLCYKFFQFKCAKFMTLIYQFQLSDLELYNLLQSSCVLEQILFVMQIRINAILLQEKSIDIYTLYLQINNIINMMNAYTIK